MPRTKTNSLIAVKLPWEAVRLCVEQMSRMTGCPGYLRMPNYKTIDGVRWSVSGSGDKVILERQERPYDADKPEPERIEIPKGALFEVAD